MREAGKKLAQKNVQLMVDEIRAIHAVVLLWNFLLGTALIPFTTSVLDSFVLTAVEGP